MIKNEQWIDQTIDDLSDHTRFAASQGEETHMLSRHYYVERYQIKGRLKHSTEKRIGRFYNCQDADPNAKRGPAECYKDIDGICRKIVINLNAHKEEIDKWIEDGSVGRLDVCCRFSDPIGECAVRELGGDVRPANGLLVGLCADDRDGYAFKVATAYPILTKDQERMVKREAREGKHTE